VIEFEGPDSPDQEAAMPGSAECLVGRQLTNGRQLCFIALGIVYADIKATTACHVKLYL
jgi:hypothetical protein